MKKKTLCNQFNLVHTPVDITCTQPCRGAKILSSSADALTSECSG